MSHKHFISLYSRGFGQIFDWLLNRINNAELSRNDLTETIRIVKYLIVSQMCKVVITVTNVTKYNNSI